MADQIVVEIVREIVSAYYKADHERFRALCENSNSPTLRAASKALPDFAISTRIEKQDRRKRDTIKVTAKCRVILSLYGLAVHGDRVAIERGDGFIKLTKAAPK